MAYAIEKLNYEWQWFDKRKSIDHINFDDGVIGLLVNIVQKRFYLFNTRHWIAIKMINNDIYLIDSRASNPIKFADLNDCHKYLGKIISKNSAEIIVVKDKNAEQSII